MGNAYNNSRQYEKAIDFHRKAMEIDKQLGNKQEIEYNVTAKQMKKEAGINSAIISEDEPITAVAGGEAGQIGLQKESQEFEKHESGLIKDANIEEGSQSVSSDPAGLGESENERDASVEYEKAIDCYRKALTIAEELGGKGEVQKTCQDMGNSYHNTGQYDEAIDCYRKALKIAEELGDRKQVGKTYQNMGNSYNNIAQYQVLEELGDKAEMEKTSRKMGGLYNNTGRYDLVIDYRSKALEIAEELGDKGEVERIYSNMGAVYNNIGQYKKATDCHRKAMEIAKILGDKQEMEYNVTAKQTKIGATINSAIISEVEPVTAVTGGQEGQIGEQKESQEFKKHENVESGLIKDANVENKSTQGSENHALVDSTASNSCKNENGAETEPTKNDTQSINGQQQESKEELNNPPHISFVRKRRRTKRKSLISPELRESLKSIEYIEGFGVLGKELIIHVLEDHEEEIEQCITEALEKHPFDGEWRTEIFYESDYIELYSDSAGGHSLYRKLSCLLKDAANPDGTIGCFIKFKKHGESAYNGKMYAVTCEHVVKPEKNNDLISFYTSNDKLELKEFSRKIELSHVNRKVPMDIALIPIEESCDAFNFERDEYCKVYDDETSKLSHKKVQKQGAITGLTHGEITEVSTSHKVMVDGKKEYYDDLIVIKSSVPDKVFSKRGDSGSLVTLTGNDGEEIHEGEALSMVLAGKEKRLKKEKTENKEENIEDKEKTKLTYTFLFCEAIDHLLEKNHIENDYVILSKFVSKARIEEGSQSASGDPAGLGESENERVASMEPSPNRSGFCDENSNNTVEEKIQSGTEALGGPAGGLGESKDKGIAFVKPSPNTNEIEEGSQSGIQSTAGDPAGLGKSENESVASMEPSPNRSGFCEENSNNTVEEKIQPGTEALGGPAGGLGESKDEGIVFVKPSPNTNEIKVNSHPSSSDRVGLDKSENERDVSVEPSPNRSGFCNEIKDEKLHENIRKFNSKLTRLKGK